jgi:hypothetical protein
MTVAHCTFHGTEGAEQRHWSMSVIAFHEKAGRSQGDSFWYLLVTLFLPPSRYCRHPSIRTLR